MTVSTLRGGFAITHYDVRFHDPHHVNYDLGEDYFEVETCVSGELLVNDDGAGPGALRPGVVALSPRAKLSGRTTIPGGVRYRGVSVSGSWVEVRRQLGEFGLCVPEEAASGPGLYAGQEPEALQWLGPAMVDLFAQAATGRPAHLAYAESSWLRVLARLASPPRATSARVEAVAEYERAAVRAAVDCLWRRRYDPPTMAQLSAQFGFSEHRLQQVHTALFGGTVWARHRRRCLEFGALLLRDTTWTTDRIAHEAGYSSASNFTYAFRRTFGVTPGTYRSSRAQPQGE